jgi:hypothetical protein
VNSVILARKPKMIPVTTVAKTIVPSIGSNGTMRQNVATIATTTLMATRPDRVLERGLKAPRVNPPPKPPKR